MAKKVIFYTNNPNIVKEQAEINKVEFTKFTPDEICPQVFKKLKII